MASNAIAGVGTIFLRAGVALAEVTSITGPGMTREQIDVTSLDSDGGYREFIAGFRDGGTVTLNMNFTASTFALILADFDSDVLQSYEIILPDAALTSLDFMGLVTELPLSIPTDDKVTVDVTIKISGRVTSNSGTGT